MALVILGPQIKLIRGRFGGVYFKSGPDGQHIQKMPRVWHYPRTPAQEGAWGHGSGFFSTGAKGFSGASALWMLALLGFFGALWVTWALANLFITKEGGEKHITGYNWYIHYAMRFPEAERPPFWKPPRAVNDMPAFIVTYRNTWTYEHTPLEWPGESPTDYYWEYATYNDKPAYLGDDRKWWLYWEDPIWVLSTVLGEKPAGFYYESSGGDIVDYYQNPVSKRFSHVYFGNPEERLKPH
ncbi:hypothetical protein KAR91_84365 [Candidatus Pacearchaeota archaeon]|nr:hypothetical protein [Candidatus Pacearchaeota archaeon]